MNWFPDHCPQDQTGRLERIRRQHGAPSFIISGGVIGSFSADHESPPLLTETFSGAFSNILLNRGRAPYRNPQGHRSRRPGRSFPLCPQAPCPVSNLKSLLLPRAAPLSRAAFSPRLFSLAAFSRYAFSMTVTPFKAVGYYAHPSIPGRFPAPPIDCPGTYESRPVSVGLSSKRFPSASD